MVSSLNINGISADLSAKAERYGGNISLAQEDVSLLKANVGTLTPSLSQEAIEKSMNDLLQSRNSIIIQSRSQVNGISNDVDSYFSSLQADSSLSPEEMSGLIAGALQSYDGSGNSTTLSMDLAVTKGMLRKLVKSFVPEAAQAQSFSEVDRFISAKKKAQDELLRDMTSRSLDIARQYGTQSDQQYFEQQLELLSAGTHDTQNQRAQMLSVTESSDDSSAWLSALAQTINKNDDSDFFKNISAEHINGLKIRIKAFANKFG